MPRKRFLLCEWALGHVKACGSQVAIVSSRERGDRGYAGKDVLFRL
jgi:hypothetical protein